MSDRITISQLSIHLPNGLGPSAFGLTPPPPCPILLDIIIHLKPHIIPLVSNYDSMASLGVNYSSVSKSIYAALTPSQLRFTRAEEVLEVVAGCVLGLDSVGSVDVTLSLPRAALHADSIRYRAVYTAEGNVGDRECEIRDLKVACVVGLHPHERGEKQRLEVDLLIKAYVVLEGGWDHKRIHDRLHRDLEASSAGTLEALADQIAQRTLSTLNSSSSITLTIRKPSALPFATPSIRITRSSSDYTSQPQASGSTPYPSIADEEKERGMGPIFVALGSNIGDRFGNIRRAIRLLDQEGVRCVGTGRMYESEPMYVEDQARFANTVIQIETDLEPLRLLKVLKKVERATGRTKTFTNGPRVVDLDLLFHGSQAVKVGAKGDKEDESGVGWLELPHWGIAERVFVLRPLNDMAPTFIHPTLNLPISVLLSRHSQTLIPVVPTTSPLRLDYRQTLIMAIFNATPDSFSDGSIQNLNLKSAISSIEGMLSSPHRPDILDIGGMSTRPGSSPCSEQEELDRVIPLIKTIRERKEWESVMISVDTYRPSVAKRAIEAGGDMINDVRGGREEGMLETVAELGVPYVLMHSRGDSSTMTSAESQNYPEGVMEGVKRELGESVEKALKAGVKAWDIILDPGIGFAKSPLQSIELLKGVDQLQPLPCPTGTGTSARRYPVLVGASRKGFVGRITGRVQAQERGWGDAVVNAHCLARGVEILRVHDWRGARESVEMARALQ